MSVSLDNFHNVRAVRYRRGRDSPAGFWLDSYDYARFRTDVLDPLGPSGDRRYRPAAHDLATDAVLDPPWQVAPPGSVVIVDGLFLHRDELADRWDFSVLLDVPFAVTAARMAARDGSDPDPDHPSLHRYVQAQRIYTRDCAPRERATVVVDNAHLDAPTLTSGALPEFARPTDARRLWLRVAELARERPAGEADDVHFPEALARFVIQTFSNPGDRVLDPFAGYGTTVAVAERLGRRGVGIELLPGRAERARRRLGGAGEIVCADARRLDDLELGGFGLCLTSPPYMNAVTHPENPLTGYRTGDGCYPRYLAELAEVFAAIARRLQPAGLLVLSVADVLTGDLVTPLADDLLAAAERSFALREVIPVDWDTTPTGLVDDRLLVFEQR